MRFPRSPVLPAVVALACFGATLRLMEYCTNRPLWADEASVALNIGRRSFAGLFGPLDYDQGAPPLFLILIKAVTFVAGMGEASLRFVPLLAGLLVPLMLWSGGRSLAGDTAAAFAATLAAISLPLIRYSAELKQYQVDVLVAVVLLALTQRVRVEPEDRRRWLHLGVAGCLGLALSIPALFVLAGAGLALLSDARVRRAPRVLPRAGPVAAAWALTFVALLLVTYGRQAVNPYLQSYWQGTFLLPRSPDLGARLYRLIQSVLEPLPLLPEVRLRWVLALGLLGGIALFRRAGFPALCLLLGPALAAAAASGLGRYAVATRLMLFLVPTSFLLAGALIAWVLAALRVGERHAPAVAVAAGLLCGAPGVIRNGLAPYLPEEGRESARWLLGAAGSEPVYVIAPGVPAWAYYSTEWTRPDPVLLDRYAWLARADGPAAVDALLPDVSGPAGRAALDLPGRRLTLVGTRSGLQSSEPRGLLRDKVDPEWARREVERILATGAPYAWLYGAHLLGDEVAALRSALARAGAVPAAVMEEKFAIALRVRLPHPLPAARNAPP